MLTEKQKAFCKEIIINGMQKRDAYMKAYNSKSPASAAVEANRLLKRDDIKEYIEKLNKPLEMRFTFSVAERKKLIKERIELCKAKNDEQAIARYLTILNQMEGLTSNTTNNTVVTNLDTETLKKLTNSPQDSTDTSKVLDNTPPNEIHLES